MKAAAAPVTARSAAKGGDLTKVFGAVRPNKRDAVVTALTGAGALPGAADAFTYTPLHLAATQGGIAAVRALLAAGASHKLTDRQGTTPLQLAKSRGYREMAKMLEDAGAR